MMKPSSVGNTLTGVWYVRPDRRPRCTTSPRPGIHGAMCLTTRFRPTLFHCATRAGIGMAPPAPACEPSEEIVSRGRRASPGPGWRPSLLRRVLLLQAEVRPEVRDRAEDERLARQAGR